MQEYYDKLTDFQNLYKAHRTARLGKRGNAEVINFEMNLAENLTGISDSLKNGTYELSGYYSFMIHDPKDRIIHALHYRDRVVQHCLCDEIIAPILDRKLIYDNAACRIGKGTHFALKRVSGFCSQHYRKHGAEGYFLKCDIRKFFDSIDHEILKRKLEKVFGNIGHNGDNRLIKLLFKIIDSYEKTPGKGLPLGNQTSQWFAIYYLDGFDRLIKEKLGIKYYSRYMDDCVLIHHDREYLKYCLEEMRRFMSEELHLEFNEKTQIFPIKNGVNYLGWHIYITETGKVVRKVKVQTKHKYKRKLRSMKQAYEAGHMELADIKQVVASYNAHLGFGHTYKLRRKVLGEFVLHRSLRD